MLRAVLGRDLMGSKARILGVANPCVGLDSVAVASAGIAIETLPSELDRTVVGRLYRRPRRCFRFLKNLFLPTRIL